MAKQTDVSYRSQTGSGHTRIDKMPGVNVGHNPGTGKAESLNTSSKKSRQALIAELEAIDAFDDPANGQAAEGRARSCPSAAGCRFGACHSQAPR